MDRTNLEHIIRAAADATGEEDILVFGSQAILGEHPDAPDALRLSPEADVYPRYAPELADEIDGALGENSPFHTANGYYAHGLRAAAETWPVGWEDRLVRVSNANTITPGKTGRQAVGWCVEAHDLVAIKATAGRPKDYAYAIEAIAAGVVRADNLRERVASMNLPREALAEAKRRLEGIIVQAARRGPVSSSPGGGSDSGRRWVPPHTRGGTRVRGYWRGR